MMPFTTLQVHWLSHNTEKKAFFLLFLWIDDQTGSRKQEIWVALESLCQDLSKGTFPNSVGALVEPQCCKTKQKFCCLFPNVRPNWILKTGNMVAVEILMSSPIQGYLSLLRRCPG